MHVSWCWQFLSAWFAISLFLEYASEYIWYVCIVHIWLQWRETRGGRKKVILVTYFQLTSQSILHTPHILPNLLVACVAGVYWWASGEHKQLHVIWWYGGNLDRINLHSKGCLSFTFHCMSYERLSSFDMHAISLASASSISTSK